MFQSMTNSAKRKRDRAQPYKREAQARPRAALQNAKRKRDRAQPYKNRPPLQ